MKKPTKQHKRGTRARFESEIERISKMHIME